MPSRNFLGLYQRRLLVQLIEKGSFTVNDRPKRMSESRCGAKASNGTEASRA
jgi:hypothetical protein